MAIIEKLQFDNGSKKIFNIGHPVGAGSANWWTDIQLVQYFIFYIYSLNNNGSSTNWKATPLTAQEWQDLPNPNVDFKALAKTQRWIRRFQSDGVKKGTPIKIDGRVDLIRGVHPTRSMKNYTIHVLNWTFETALKQWQGINNYVEWALNDTNMPQMLKSQLRSGKNN